MTEPHTDKTDVTPVPETLWYEERGIIMKSGSFFDVLPREPHN